MSVPPRSAPGRRACSTCASQARAACRRRHRGAARSHRHRATSSTDLRAYPTGPGTPPTVSNLNTTAGTTRANLVAVRTGDEGRVRLRNAGGTVHLVGYVVEAG